MRILTPFLHTALVLLMGFGLPLRAQLDPRLQTANPKFLDLYMQSAKLNTVKPEVLTVLDFTGSMAVFMFAKDYPAPASDSGTDRGITFNLIGPGDGAKKDKYGTVLPIGRYDVTASLNFGTSLPLANGSLVRPDGSLLEFKTNGDTTIQSQYDPINSFEPAGGIAKFTEELAKGMKNQADVRNWVRCASHVRFTYKSLTYDIPIGWTALGSSKIVRNEAAGEYRNQYMTYPLRFTLKDPATGKEMEIDRSYRVINGCFTSGSGATSATINSTYVGHRQAHLQWVWNLKTGAPSTIPTVNLADLDHTAAFANGIPAYTRTTAIKNTFMILWAKYWNKVLWANRFIHDWRDATPAGGPYPVTEGGLINNNSGTAGASGLAFHLSNDSRTIFSAGDHLKTPVVGGSQRGWALMNGNSYNSLVQLSSYVGDGYTMLNYAMVNALAQYNDPKNVFNDVETGDDAPIACRKSFLILFTDGQPNSEAGSPGSTISPYYDGASAHGSYLQGDAITGNKEIRGTYSAGTTTCLEPGSSKTSTAYGGSQPTGQWFNILTLAAVAAHGADSDLATLEQVPSPASYPVAAAWPTVDSTKPDKVFPFIPFALKNRGTGATFVPFDKPHLITTMTVGVSLGQATWSGNTPGAIKPTDPKFRMLAAAAMGDPDTKSWNLKTIKPFALKVPGHPEKGKADGTCYYFDATDPDSLTESLDAAFAIAGAQSNINQTASPNIPFVGSSFGHQIYLGKFQPPSTGGVIWPGDLYMFATKEVANQTVIIDQAGIAATTFDNTTAGWSASNALFYTNPVPVAPKLNGRRWTDRHLFTRLPGVDKLIPFTDVDAKPASPATEWPPATAVNGYTTPFTTLKPYLAKGWPTAYSPVLADSVKKGLMQMVAGADMGSTLDAAGRPYNNRNATIMGDVIDSSPQVLEYTFSSLKSKIPATSLLSKWSSFSSANRFRLILVGTNQGWLHAFGEVSIQTGDPDPNNSGIVYTGPTKGAVDELWAFMPTDFLANLDTMSSGTSPHRFMVDGSPAIYFLDLPPSGGGSGNGTFDIGSPPKERAIAIIGLGQGGRSYYALDLSDPFNPSLLWSFVPDEATSGSLMSNMGLATCAPAFGRVMYNGVLKDVVFLGGGHSDDILDGNFPTWPKPVGQNTPLGRSVFALDVNTGAILTSVDMTTVANSAGIGSISKGLVPFEFFLNSGMAQRAYFLDYAGGLWSWGSQLLNLTAPFTKYRIDSSDLAKWTTDGTSGGSAGIRKVAQDQTIDNARYTTLPAPFRVSVFPVAPKKTGDAVPAAVGIAMISGDRNNPLDNQPPSGGTPTQHRLTVVFDRQDSAQWSLDTGGILDTQLLDASTMKATPALTSPEVVPGNAAYYLSPTSGTPNFGYKVNLPTASAKFTPKGITSPSVVAGSIFYSYFNPESSDPCTGGSGTGQTRIICDVVNPILSDSRGVSCLSGNIGTKWAGVPSDFALYGTRGVIQGGVVSANPIPPAGTGSNTVLRLQTLLGRTQERFPKVRVWRTVR